jgi:hypothetical protein
MTQAEVRFLTTLEKAGESGDKVMCWNLRLTAIHILKLFSGKEL